MIAAWLSYAWTRDDAKSANCELQTVSYSGVFFDLQQ
jgi:hypothetical protein